MPDCCALLRSLDCVGGVKGTAPQPEAVAHKAVNGPGSADSILNWLSENKQWVFSGIGVLVLSGLGSVIRLAFRGRSRSGARAEAERPQASVSKAANSTMTDSIPLTTQTLNLMFDARGNAPPLTMKDGKKARAEVHLAWKVVNPYLFCFSAKDHPFDVLVPLLLARTRENLEGLKLDDPRAQRREAETHIKEMLVNDFKKRGIEIESILFGAVEELNS